MQGNVSVNDKMVEASTQLTYNLLLSSSTVQQNDYLMINLPQTQDISFSMGRAFCTIQSPLTVNQCNVVTPQQAQITFGSGATGYQLSGTIGYFNNPSSTITVTDIQFTLYSSSGTQKAVFLSGTIYGFTPTTLTVSLSSSSTVVGANVATLKATVTSATMIPGTGTLLLNFPLYYTNSGTQDQMISTTSPICSGTDITVLSCYFTPQSRLLTLNYKFNDGNDRYAAVDFSIQSFKNPINPIPKTGFSLTILDAIGNQVAQQLSATLSGVTTPTSFKFVTYQFVDTNLIGQYNSFLLNIGMNVPLEQTCFIKIQFPSEFTLDSSLYTMEGTSFFMQAGATSNQIPWTSINLSNRSIIIHGCEYIYGANMLGSITFKKIMNPQYIKDSNPFQITLAKDDQFTQVIAQTTSGVFVASTDLQPGSITGISISASNSEVSASTSLLIQFTPQTSLSQSQYRIIVVLPPSFQLGSSCQVTNKSPLLSNSASCSFDSSALTVTINAPFTSSYVGGQTLFFTITPLTNPISVQVFGSFTISTQILANGSFYSVDTGTVASPLTTTAGLANGLDYVYSSNLVTYSGDTTYIFKVSFTHVVPAGGKIRVVMPDNMSVADQSRLQAYCYRLDKSPTPIKLNCVSSQQYFDVNMPQGLPASEAYRLQVVALRNPRAMGQSAMFKVQSYDSQGRLIDETRSDQYLIINMKQVGQMNLVTVTPTNGTTGATTQYGIVINSNTPIYDGDQVSLTFPPEITLPATSYISCSGNTDYVTIVYCTKVNSNSVNIQLTDVTTISAGLGFIIYFSNILNPPSTRPTSSFSGISLRDLYNSQISQYSQNDVTVTLTSDGLIKVFSLQQSTKAPNQQATYMIKFQTNNDLPPASAIIVRTPSTVFVSRDPSLCYVMTSSMRQNVCTFDDQTTIKITNAFNDQFVNYSGPVEIYFSAVNPSDNSDTSLSLSLTIYDDKTFIYKVDQIPKGLNPSFMCSYPCQTCQLNNPSFCLSCPVGQYEPIYLQPDRKTAIPTCVRACNTGYTVSNNPKQSKVCQPCDVSCETCRAGGTPLDQNFCTKCSATYPVYWQQNAQCFTAQQGCPSSTYTSTANRCTTCPSPCMECKTKNVCLRCDPGNPLSLLDRGVCVSKCSITQTVMKASNGTSYCQDCQSPCKTCQPGLPNNCLTCVNPTSQFLFGNACLSQCPAGTSKNITTFSCEGCQEGCSLCESKNQKKCLDCSNGLSLLNGTCYPQCPATHLKSIDGKVCELRQYPLDNNFVPFPFTLGLLLLWALSLVFFLVSKKKAQLVQCFIISDAIIMIAATIYQFIQSNHENQPIVLTISILIMILNVVVSVVFGITFTIQVNDYKFNQYKANHRIFYWTVMGMSCLFSLHMFRILFCKMFNSAVFHANATSPDDFFKPLRLYSLIFIVAVCLPNFSGNCYFIAVTWNGNFWDNQLQMTMFEQLILSLSMSILVAYDRFFIKPKHIVFEAEQNNPYHIKQFESQQRLVQVGSSFNDSAYQPMAEKAVRHSSLKEILSSVRRNKDLKLNANLDEVMETEMFRRPVKNPTDPDVPATELYNSDDEDHFNMSFPGLNPPYQDDGTGRRFELLHWMEEQVELNAQEERIQAQIKEKLIRQFDKQSQYDNQMYDNVYFSPVTKRKLIGAEMQTIEERKPVPILHLSQMQQTTNRQKIFQDMSQQDSRKSLLEKQMLENSIMEKSQQKSIEANLIRQQKNYKNKVASNKEQVYQQTMQQPENVSPIARQYSRDESEDEILGDEFANDKTFEQQSEKSLKLRDSRNSLVKSELISRSSKNGTIGPETKKWVKRVQLMKTLLLDGTSPRRRPRTPGGNFREEKRGSDTGQTLSQRHHETLVEVNINEETISLGAEEFYKNNKASLDGSDSASSVRTSDLDEPVMKERQDLEAFLREKVTVNNRNFNINEVLGNFPVDSSGQIIGRKEVIFNSNFRDIDAQLVNERGYLINEKTGAIRSRYTYEDLFLPITNSAKDYGELPMPYRWERWNFNPHKILGNFEYDVKTKKPVFLKNKYGQLTDKNYLPVNQSGFLINEREDIVDNEGHMMFNKAMLTAQGNIPNLLSYQAKSYKIQDIIGQVKKDDVSKEILVRVDQRNGRAVDDRGRQVNANGYLIDFHGNIVNQNGDVIFRFWELTFQEPPKIFAFTQFSVDWIKGRVKKGGIQVKDDDLYDLDGRLINTKGYLIDKDDNIVDYYGRIVFRKELLTENTGQDSEIPKVFLCGVLAAPKNQEDFSAVNSNLPNIQISNYDKKQSGRVTESEVSNQKTDTALGKSFANNKSDLAQTLNRRHISIFSVGDGDATVISGPHFSPQKQLDVRKTELIQDFKHKIELINVEEGPKEEQKKLKRTGTSTSGNRKSKKKLEGEEKSRQYQQSRTVRPGTKVISLYQQYIENGNVDQQAFDQGLFTENASGKQVITPVVLPPRTPIAGSRSVGRRNDYTPTMTNIATKLQNNVQRFQGSEHRHHSRRENVLSPSLLQAGQALSAHGFMSDGQSIKSLERTPNKHVPKIQQNGFFGDSLYSGHNDRNGQGVTSMQSFASRAEMVFQNQNLLRRLDSDIPSLDLELRGGNHIEQQVKQVNNIYGSSIYKRKR